MLKIIIIFCCIQVGVFSCLIAQSIDLVYISEVQYNLKSETNWCHLLRIDAACQIGERGCMELAINSIYKTRSKRIINDWQAFSNIEEENLLCGIAILGYTHCLGHSRLFIGVRNLNEDYFISQNMSFFTNSSCGIFPSLSQNYPIANYPLSGFCVDYKLEKENWILKSSLYNGMAYNGWQSDNHPFIINLNRDGIFGITEANYEIKNGNYYGGFAIHYLPTGNRDEKQIVRPISKMKFCWWGYMDQCLWKTDKQELNLLLQYAENFSRESICKKYMASGMAWSAYSAQNKLHQIGVISSFAKFKYGNEIACELTYRYCYNKNLCLQPTIHLIKNNEALHKIFLFRISYEVNWKRK